MADVEKHNTADDLWTVIDGRVYDLTKFAMKHPGGHLPLINMAGKDATDAFVHYHPASVWEKQLPYYHVADVDTVSTEFIEGYRNLRQQLLERGLYKTRYSFYVGKAVVQLCLFGASLWCTLYGGSFALHMAGAVLMAAFWQQLAFIGHDTGHNAISHRQTVDNLVGIAVGNTLGGISIGWWKRSHNVHHIVCNSMEHDPDIQHLPALAIDGRMLQKPFYSTYHAKWFAFDPLARFLVTYQHFTYYLVMGVARFNLYVQSLKLLFSSEHVHFKALEIGALALFATWYCSLVATLPSAGERLLYVLLSHFLSGILHVQITLSHFAMPAYHGRTYTGEKDGWFTTQLATSMNIRSNWLTDWFHGGLQFQVEHHLFPRLPRHNLRQARALVIPFAAKHGIPHLEVSFWEANAMVLRTLRKAAMEARTTQPAVGWAQAFTGSMTWEGMNARG